jgi:hypothetical protein
MKEIEVKQSEQGGLLVPKQIVEGCHSFPERKEEVPFQG